MTEGAWPRGRFATTRWTLVVAAGRRSDAQSDAALANLCEVYWHPVYSLIRRQGHTPEESADLTQEFFTRVLEKNYFHAADPARGSFRAFLCASVRHFLSNERDRARALKRGGNNPPISLDVETAEGTYTIEPRDDLTPERVFDRQWATIMLDRVLSLVFVTPNVHKIHHSREISETNSNYANLTTLYDRLLGTYTPAERAASVVYGLDDVDPKAVASLPGLLAMPFRDADASIVPDTKVRIGAGAGR